MGNIFSVNISTDKMFSCFKGCSIKRATYICQLEDNLDALKTALQDLAQAKNDLTTRVIIAEQKQMKRLNKVQLWLTRVKDVEIKVGQLQKDGAHEIQNLCVGGCCSKNFKSSYKLGQKIVKTLQLVDFLRAQGAFDVVAEWVPAAAVNKRTIDQPTIVGQQPTFDKVWRCLEQEDVGIIGIYGMGGVGKTTLLTQINNEFFNMLNDFDVVIWVTVSKDLQLQKIQEDIGKMLCLFNDSWNNKNLEDKAEDISKILNQKKFVLLLDDIWERVDLTKVGVPLPDRVNGSKVVFTTRFINVCGLMEAQKKFKVECLQPEEAWELFKMKVGENTLNNHPDIPQLAKSMAEECDGLPIALITIGRAMVYKNAPQEWKHEIEVLRRSASKFQGMQLVYPHLKFSYDKLQDDKTRTCFLYCCLFPEDYKIQKRKLIDYWIGEGFLDENDRRKSQNEGYSIIGTLVRACLLEVEDDYIKMHDVIRDMALWIANDIEQEKENVLVRTGAGLTEAPNVRKWEGVRRISLMENKIEDLSEIPTSPDLQTLFLNRNTLKMITPDFFQSMHSLRVLNLSNNPSLTQLPPGVSKLVAVRHVDLSNTGIQELPEELKDLVDLKYLNLEHTVNLRTIPEQLICNFSSLHVLRMFECGYSGEILTEKLLHSTNLEMFSINLKSSYALRNFLRPGKLKRRTQTLGLQCLEEYTLDVVFLADMKHLNTLCISECKNLEELAIDCGWWGAEKIGRSHGFHSLHTIEINSCSKLRHLTWILIAPNLKILSVLYCCDMEEVISVLKWTGDPKIFETMDPFANLEILQLEGLPNLRSIFWRVLPFPRLKEVSVLECPKLDELPLDSKSADDSALVIMGKEYWWQKLQWKDPATRMAFRQCFKSIEFPSHADLEDASTDGEFDPSQISQAELQDRHRQSLRILQTSEQSKFP